MDKLVIKTATEDDFFKRGKKLATLADTKQPLPQEHTITFECSASRKMKKCFT